MICCCLCCFVLLDYSIPRWRLPDFIKILRMKPTSKNSPEIVLCSWLLKDKIRSHSRKYFLDYFLYWLHDNYCNYKRSSRVTGNNWNSEDDFSQHETCIKPIFKRTGFRFYIITIYAEKLSSSLSWKAMKKKKIETIIPQSNNSEIP